MPPRRPASAAPRKPCSGLNSATRSIPASRSRVTSLVPRESTPDWFGHQSHAAAADQLHAVAQQDLDPRTHPSGRRAIRRRPRRCAPERTILTAPATREIGAPETPRDRDGLVVCLRSRRAADRSAAPGSLSATEAVAFEPEVDELLAGLSVRDRIAQLVVPWIPGTYAAYDDDGFARAEAWVDSLHVGGVIVSVGSPLDIAAKLNGLQRAPAFRSSSPRTSRAAPASVSPAGR